jgi:hypothetical protein
MDPIRWLAEEIAKDLFTDGTGVRARRLVHEDESGRLRGGWAEKPVADRVEDLLRRRMTTCPE